MAKTEKRKFRDRFRKDLKKKMKKYQRLNLRACNHYEMVLFEKIKQSFGSNIIRQYRIGFYFIDLLIQDRLLAIEVDGSSHNSITQQSKDLKKEHLIKRMGLSILRIRNEETDDWNSIKSKIEKFPIHKDHSTIFKKIHSRVTGSIGWITDKMAKSASKRNYRVKPHVSLALRGHFEL